MGLGRPQCNIQTQDADAVGKVGLCWLVIFITIDLMAEMILLYRCWIVWGRRWVIVAVPGFLAFIALGQGFAYAGLVKFSLDSVNFSEKFGGLIAHIGIAAYSISLVVSALTTTLIVTKILLTSRRVHSAPGSNLHRPLRVIAAMLIESGLLMFAFQLVFVVLLSFNPTIVSIVTGSTAQIYGITPSLLNIRVMMGAAYGETTEKMASLRFAHSRAATHTTGPSMGEARVQSQ
ncbi:hypothetical protein BD779DRAFT_1012304 [Infundibulicybe gibba]|nr:hypothetical protein BD779DRAFT_1012304 [Infundibulicybe gibba]